MYFVIDWVRRRRAARKPFPEAWHGILRRRVPFYERLEADEKKRFDAKLKIFVLTKHFTGVQGLVIDDEVRVTIGAAAARLVMNLPNEHYQRLVEIVVYPSHFKLPKERHAVMLGQAFGAGTVVLSWDAVAEGLAHPNDGHDTATHEFAHALDGADGYFDGIPDLESFSAYAPWTEVMSDAFKALQARRRETHRDVLRDYGATNEAEFFAVATEAFFEKPARMRQRHPKLYELLAGYYHQHPAPPPRS